MTKRLKKTTTTTELPDGGVIMIDAAEIAARFIGFVTTFEWEEGKSASDFIERCIEEDESLMLLLELAMVASRYIQEQLDANAHMHRCDAIVPDVPATEQ